MGEGLTQRVPEPEIMDDPVQAEAYAAADFEEPHGKIIELFEARFPGVEVGGDVLDLGCGPGDVTLRFAMRFKGASIIGVDGSGAMVTLADKAKERKKGLNKRVRFLKSFIPLVPGTVPEGPYSLILSTSFLHHLHDPSVLWECVKRYSSKGAMVFVVDLFRPRDRAGAKRLVELYSADEPEVLKRDFYNSLLAAFRPGEVEAQLARSGLTGLKVEVVSDRHMVIFGVRG